MQKTAVRDSGKSGSSVQPGAGVQSVGTRITDGRIVVVVMCSRCPAESPVSGDEGNAQPGWSCVRVDRGNGSEPHLLCKQCTRDHALWFLSPSEGARV